MAIPNPATYSDFLGQLPLRPGVFRLSEAVEVSETGGGEVLTSDYGQRLWRGTVSLLPMRLSEAGKATGLVDYFRAAARPFHATDAARCGPLEDPDGTTLGAATPTVLSRASAKTISFQGLPVGYVLTVGDRLTVTTSSGRAVLLQLVEGVTADGTGETAAVTVAPTIPASVATGDSVTLVRPYCKAIIQPGSFSPGGWDGQRWSGMSFSWVESI